jgi:hypothetical protein
MPDADTNFVIGMRFGNGAENFRAFQYYWRLRATRQNKVKVLANLDDDRRAVGFPRAAGVSRCWPLTTGIWGTEFEVPAQQDMFWALRLEAALAACFHTAWRASDPVQSKKRA